MQNLNSQDEIYLYSQAMELLSADAAVCLARKALFDTQLFACPSAAKRRQLEAFPLSWLSLPQLLMRWQSASVTHFGEHLVAPVNFSSCNLLIELCDASPLNMLEACELALAALALDWQVELSVTRAVAARLSIDLADATTKPFASLPLFGTANAWLSELDAQVLENSSVLPIKLLSEADRQRLAAHPARIVM